MNSGRLHFGYTRRMLLALCLAFVIFAVPAAAAGGDGAFIFPIRAFELTGNTLMGRERLAETLAPFFGENRTAADIEQAWDTLERLYREAGHSQVEVQLPAQMLQGGIVKLLVIERSSGHRPGDSQIIDGNQAFGRSDRGAQGP